MSVPGVRYVARPDRLHAKAGNLNHALQYLEGDLIAVLDADVMPLRNFLQRTVPFFLIQLLVSCRRPRPTATLIL